MVKINPVGVSALALGAALASGNSFAAVPRQLVVATVADYNAALVTQAGGTLTVKPDLAVYTVTSGSLEVNSRFTVTLPSGFTFFSQPSVFPSDVESSLSLVSGGIGSQTATFAIQGAPVPTDATVTIDQFSVQGATALEAPIQVIDGLPIAMQATNNSLITNNDSAPLTAHAFASEPGALATFVGAIQFLDLSSPVFGTEFGTSPSNDSKTAVLSAIALSPQLVDAATETTPVLTASGARNSLATSDTATVTISGIFNGISAVFSSTQSSCTTSLQAGTVTPSSVTIPGVPFNREIFFCVTADGTSLLQQNPLGFNPTVAPGTSTDFLGAGVNNEFPGLWTYFGGGVVEVTNFFTGDDAGYTSVLRVNNSGTGPSELFALVQPDTGGPLLTGPIGLLGAGVGTVFTEAQIQADVPGLNLANSGQRSTLQLIAGNAAVAEAVVGRPAGLRLTAESAAVAAKHFPAGHGALPAVVAAPKLGVISAAGFLVNPGGAVTQLPKPGSAR